ncbi:hypothetical protein GCM10010915_06780 [Microbacterium faecale]|uniref:YtxH domain-containing protein n=1 Tax=Microbacterium faecale TaxID=1804630 RepID=A0A917DDM3_9MICO|nr:hypothetical protein [Microbacterium faecale]GGD29259.1 hypothetical protein GCM10010915_06780 [Microbacterium faecale]
MRGKLGLIVGLGIGYVLGTRAGRARYEQLKAQAEKVWELDAVQKQVGKAKDFAQQSAMTIPRVAWDGLTKVAKAAAETSGSAEDKAEAAAGEAKTAARKTKTAVSEAKKAAD